MGEIAAKLLLQTLTAKINKISAIGVFIDLTIESAPRGLVFLEDYV